MTLTTRIADSRSKSNNSRRVGVKPISLWTKTTSLRIDVTEYPITAPVELIPLELIKVGGSSERAQRSVSGKWTVQTRNSVWHERNHTTEESASEDYEGMNEMTGRW